MFMPIYLFVCLCISVFAHLCVCVYICAKKKEINKMLGC